LENSDGTDLITNSEKDAGVGDVEKSGDQARDQNG
jgi:hypothetical protein